MFTCFAVAAPGTEPWVADEIRSLGYSDVVEIEGGVEFEASLKGLMKANLWSRTASRILVRLATFPARELSLLERRVAKLELNSFFKKGDALRVKVTCKKSKIYHSGAAVERVSKSLTATHGLEVVKGTDTVPELVVRIHRDVVTVSLDSSGGHLHQRGQKVVQGKAPIRETLAAVALRAAGFDGRQPFIDPCAGSGTIVVEAAEICANRAPGMFRRFAFQDWPCFREENWIRLLDEAKALVVRPQVGIFAFDQSAPAMKSCRANLESKGLSEFVETKCRPLRAGADGVGAEHGILVANPPYGQRIGRERDVRRAHKELGGWLCRGLEGWGAMITTPRLDLIEMMKCGLEPMSAPIYHGGTRIYLVGRLPENALS